MNQIKKAITTKEDPPVVVYLRIPKSLKKQIAALAQQKQLSINLFVIELLQAVDKR